MAKRYRPMRRVYASGEVVWVARFKDRNGNWTYAKPDWNNGKATFKLKRDAQRAIDEAMARGAFSPATLGDFAAIWLKRYPRSEATNRTNARRLRAVQNVVVRGKRLKDWPLSELRRKHAVDLVDHMLREQERSASGASGILSVLSAMAEDAIGEDLMDSNPWRGVKIRTDDRRVKRPRRQPKVLTFDEMRAFAACARPEVRSRTPRPRRGAPIHRIGDRRSRARETFYSAVDYEPMLLTLGLTGMRLGELLGLHQRDLVGNVIHIRGTAYDGEFKEGDTEEKRHVRQVPVAPSLLLVLKARPTRIDTDVLFSAPGGGIFWHSNFYKEVWQPARIASGMDVNPHDFRHSFLTHLQAACIDKADLADVGGHRIDTMLAVYTHPTRGSFEAIREAIG